MLWRCIACAPPQEALGEELTHFRVLAHMDPDELTPLDVHKACTLSEACHDLPEGRLLFGLFIGRMSMHPRAVALLGEGVLRESLSIMRTEPDNSTLVSSCISALCNMIGEKLSLADTLVAQGGLGPICAAMDKFPTITPIVAPACGIMHALAVERGQGEAVRAAGGVRLLEAACENNPTVGFVMERGMLALNCLRADPAAAAKTVEFEKVRAAATGEEAPPPTAADIDGLANRSRESRCVFVLFVCVFV